MAQWKCKVIISSKTEKLKSIVNKKIIKATHISIRFSFAVKVEQASKNKKKMFKILAEKYKAAKLSYLNRSPKGKYQFVRAIGWFILKPMGINIFDPNFKVYWLSFVPLLSFIAVAISFFYTIWYNYVRGTLLVGFYMVPMLGVIIPVNK